MDGTQTLLQEHKKAKEDLMEFETLHSELVMYLLQQYEKWQELKRKVRESEIG